jgi:hypothetical protein
VTVHKKTRVRGRPPDSAAKFSGPEFRGLGGVLREFIYLTDFPVLKREDDDGALVDGRPVAFRVHPLEAHRMVFPADQIVQINSDCAVGPREQFAEVGEDGVQALLVTGQPAASSQMPDDGSPCRPGGVLTPASSNPMLSIVVISEFR